MGSGYQNVTSIFDPATGDLVFVNNAGTEMLRLDASAGKPVFAAASVTYAAAKVSISAETTATGSAQNVAHGLGTTPTGVLVVPTEHPGTPDTGAFDIAEGTHTSTNVVLTVTANVKFKVFAWA